ncbi:MAG: ABC transporter ATP-binding protein [Acidobacteria bacterium]|nr:ABC transporter ATP-binding protein [Acidobacteriota bacterium]
MSEGLEARSIGFGYGDGNLFHDLSLSVRAGEMVGLIGPNGSGKTTLLRILSGVLAPRTGGVRLTGGPGGDVEMAALEAGERSRRIAVVPQESRLTFDFTAIEVVLMARAARLGLLGVESREDLDAARRAMERTGTAPFAGRLIGQLSGGERQLVFVARALAQEPGLLLLDEPTAFLDIRHRLEIYALLSDLNAREGLTVAITSHDINLAARFCRRLVLLKAGRVIADGGAAEVFRAEILSDLFDTPLRVVKDDATGRPFALP